MMRLCLAAIFLSLSIAPGGASDLIRQKKEYGRIWTLTYVDDPKIGKFCSLDGVIRQGEEVRITAYYSRSLNITLINEKWNLPDKEKFDVTVSVDKETRKSSNFLRMRKEFMSLSHWGDKAFFFDFVRTASRAQQAVFQVATGETLTLDLGGLSAGLKDWETCASEWVGSAVNIAQGTAPPPPPQYQQQQPPQRQRAGLSSGTGIILTQDGVIATNAHVVDGCGRIAVQHGEKSIDAKLVKSDPRNDLAALQVSAQFPRSFQLAEQPAQLGAKIAVFGYPLYGTLTTGGNFTLGSVTGLSGSRDDQRYLQISAPVQPGNSGGPLIDKKGRLVGVVSAKLNAIAVAERTGDVPQNVNFAIRGAVLRSFLDANKINYAVATGPAGRDRSDTDLAAAAKAMSVLVLCHPK